MAGGEGGEAARELLATVLHEVRTPLACLATTVDVMVAAYPDLPQPDALAMLQRMQRSASWLQALVDNLTVAAQLDSRQLHLRQDAVALRDCLETAAALVAPLLERAGQALELSGDLESAVRGDARRVEQVLVNLVLNASKYGGEGKPIRVGVQRAGEAVRVVVSDQGPGIEPEEQGRIFARYERGRAAERAGVTGLGLGLHIVKTLVERQGGQVGVLSHPGQGASFWFDLPAAVTIPLQLPAQRRSSRAGLGSSNGHVSSTSR